MAVDVANADEADALARATAALDAGALVLLPGDLHYVLAADALNDDAVELLREAVARPADQPLLICIGGYEDIQHVGFGSALAHSTATAAWPGPTTLLLKARPWLPEAVTAGGERVAVTAPQQPFANGLARRFGPFACAPAATEGAPPPLALQDARVTASLAIDAGSLPGGDARLVDAG